MVTVLQNDCDGAVGDDPGRHERLAEALGGLRQAVVLLEPVLVEAGGGDLAAELGVLGLEVADLVVERALGRGTTTGPT